VTPKEYLEIVKRKAAVAEATARIGAVIGGATSEEVEDWGSIGRIFGMLINIRDEFVDVFEVKELRNRIDNECLPLPMLYAMCNPKAKKEIIHLLKKEKLTKDDATKIANIVLRTKEVQRLKTKIKSLIDEVTSKLYKYQRIKNKNVRILINLSKLTLSDL
jgi:geranylgeranyl pyrophosphate synthase